MRMVACCAWRHGARSWRHPWRELTLQRGHQLPGPYELPAMSLDVKRVDQHDACYSRAGAGRLQGFRDGR